jgi:glucose-6-phosphate isomerase
MAEALQLDYARANEILLRGINPAHAAEVDARIDAIRADFRAEQGKGYSTLVRNWRAWTQSHERKAEIDRTVRLAERIRNQFQAFVLVGIGGSDLGGRTLHDTLDHPFHNQLSPSDRHGAREIYFTGDTFDPKRLLAMLDLLEARGLLGKTCVNVVSKSGKTGETIAAAMVIRERLERAGVKQWSRHIVATTGQNSESVLFEMNKTSKFFGMLPVPEGVGGRYSFASPVGLLPFAVTAVDESPRERVLEGLRGYEDAHKDFFSAEPTPNSDLGSQTSLACRLARWWHLGEDYGRKTDLLLCNYADDARLTDWFTQLYSESIQERGAGLNVIGTRGPTGNHSILNGILRGPHDKLVLMLRWLDLGPDVKVPTGTGIKGDLESFEGLPLGKVQDASCLATVDDYLANGVHTATLSVAKRDAYHLFRLMRTFMDAVAVKGRLQMLDIDETGKSNPPADLTYQQDGVEGYKKRARGKAAEMQRALK